MTWILPVGLAAIGISISARTFLTVVVVTVLIVLLLAELMPSAEAGPKSRQASARSSAPVPTGEQPEAPTPEAADPAPDEPPTAGSRVSFAEPIIAADPAPAEVASRLRCVWRPRDFPRDILRSR